jgi:hypothetical protein
MMCRHDKVTLVLAVLVIDHDDYFPVPYIGNGAFDRM